MAELDSGLSIQESVVSSSYVVLEKQPVLLVFHEYDPEEGHIWQFHCGNGDYAMEKMMLVSGLQILQLDSGLNQLSDLPVNWMATRESVTQEWLRSPLDGSEDE